MPGGGAVARCQRPARYPTEAPLESSFRHADLAVAQWVADHARRAGLGSDTLPAAPGLYVPLGDERRTVGVLAVLPENPRRVLLPEQSHLLETFAGQIALALERARLAEVAEQSTRRAPSARALRNTLLASISHDLRTPLAVMAGAGSALAAARRHARRERTRWRWRARSRPRRGKCPNWSPMCSTWCASSRARWHCGATGRPLDDLVGSRAGELQRAAGAASGGAARCPRICRRCGWTRRSSCRCSPTCSTTSPSTPRRQPTSACRARRRMPDARVRARAGGRRRPGTARRRSGAAVRQVPARRGGGHGGGRGARACDLPGDRPRSRRGDRGPAPRRAAARASTFTLPTVEAAP